MDTTLGLTSSSLVCGNYHCQLRPCAGRGFDDLQVTLMTLTLTSALCPWQSARLQSQNWEWTAQTNCHGFVPAEKIYVNIINTGLKLVKLIFGLNQDMFIESRS